MLTDFISPILLFAVDDSDVSSVKTIEQISVESAKVTDNEILNRTYDSIMSKLSDINILKNRLIIPINDRILGVEYKGGNYTSAFDVDYIGTKSVLSKSSNIVMLRFEISNSLSTLSIIADIFFGLSGSNFIGSDSARVSFFSKNICIMNAKLRGINRAVVSNSTLEIIIMSLEIVDDKGKEESQEAKKSSNQDLTNTVG